MITIVENGKDRRRIFRFVCKQCGCVYDASEDEGELITIASKTTFNPDFDDIGINFDDIGINDIKELKRIGMELECPMTFCRCKNTSFDVVNKEELERKACYKFIDGKLQYCK